MSKKKLYSGFFACPRCDSEYELDRSKDLLCSCGEELIPIEHDNGEDLEDEEDMGEEE